METGTLSIVATPIGNLGDMTLRALETLKAADVIACEDTRVTSKLLARYEIEKPLVVYNPEDARRGGAPVLERLEEGKHVALVTDAGTPGISDPGAELVACVRDTMPDVRIETIPGATALTAALSIAGLPVHTFTFLGFLPNKKGRQTLFTEIAESKRTMVFCESPHRIEKALASLAELMPKRRIAVARELTKMHESLVRGTAREVATYFVEHPDEVRGEFVVIVEGAR